MADGFADAQRAYDSMLPPEHGGVCEKTLVLAWGACDEVCDVHGQSWPCQSDEEDE